MAAVKLTEEMIIARSKQSNLEQIKKLNCWLVDFSLKALFCNIACKIFDFPLSLCWKNSNNFM